MDNHLQVDEEGFHKEMETQRERARASWVGEEEAIASIYKELLAEIGETEFSGYDTLSTHSVIKAIVKDGKVVNEATEGDEVELFLDKTPFYGESGGQVGDRGVIQKTEDRTQNSEEDSSLTPSCVAWVKETKKELGLHAHVVKIKKGSFKVWDRVSCSVDKEQRSATARNHTATHLLHTALRSVLGEHVKQAGSLVSPERMRFDFTHFYPMEERERLAIEDIVNGKVIENIGVDTEVMDIQDALRSGVTALFGEKYGESVRVVKVPGFSSELCGGTHCKGTGDIGLFVILSEGSVASGIRRIEALTGKAAFEHLRARTVELSRISEILRTDKPLERVEKLVGDLKDMSREVDSLKSRVASGSLSSIMEAVREVNGVKVLAYRMDNLELKDLRNLADTIRDKMGSGIIVLSSVSEGQASMLSSVTGDLIPKFHAGNILKEVAALAGGRGGGKPEMAQGGTKEIEKLDTALESVYDLVKKQ
jgi:alanyl-tRNA synthetase